MMQHKSLECKNCGSSMAIPAKNVNILTCLHCQSTHKISYDNDCVSINLAGLIKKHSRQIDYIEKLTAVTRKSDLIAKSFKPMMEKVGEIERAGFAIIFAAAKGVELKDDKYKLEPNERSLLEYKELLSVYNNYDISLLLEYSEEIKVFIETLSEFKIYLKKLENEVTIYNSERNKFMSNIFNRKKCNSTYDNSNETIRKIIQIKEALNLFIKNLVRNSEQEREGLSKFISADVKNTANTVWVFLGDKYKAYANALLKDNDDLYGRNSEIKSKFKYDCLLSESEKMTLLKKEIGGYVDTDLPQLKDVQIAFSKGDCKLFEGNYDTFQIVSSKQLENNLQLFEKLDLDYKLSREISFA